MDITDREQRVIIQGQSSTWVKITSGVSQGTVLGPTPLPRKSDRSAADLGEHTIMFGKYL